MGRSSLINAVYYVCVSFTGKFISQISDSLFKDVFHFEITHVLPKCAIIIPRDLRTRVLMKSTINEELDRQQN